MRFIGKGHATGLVLRLLGLSRSTYYYAGSPKPGGRPASTHTLRRDGATCPNEAVVSQILGLLGQDFVDYGYRKVTEWLKWVHAYLINGKKVMRLMRENRLTLTPSSRQLASHRRRIVEKVPQPKGPGLYYELDIKMVHVQGKRKGALILNIVDLFHREWVAYLVAWRIRHGDVLKLVGDHFSHARRTDGQRIVFRADNGSQFIANEFAPALATYGIDIEYINPATPEENAHVESFHSVMQRAMVRTHEFESIEHLAETTKRFQHFYNHERLHSATCYRPPMVFLELWKKGLVGEIFDKKNRRKFILSKEEPLSSPFSERNNVP